MPTLTCSHILREIPNSTHRGSCMGVPGRLGSFCPWSVCNFPARRPLACHHIPLGRGKINNLSPRSLYLCTPSIWICSSRVVMYSWYPRYPWVPLSLEHCALMPYPWIPESLQGPSFGKAMCLWSIRYSALPCIGIFLDSWLFFPLYIHPRHWRSYDRRNSTAEINAGIRLDIEKSASLDRTVLSALLFSIVDDLLTMETDSKSF